jgi:hypothetical protein
MEHLSGLTVTMCGLSITETDIRKARTLRSRNVILQPPCVSRLCRMRVYPHMISV